MIYHAVNGVCAVNINNVDPLASIDEVLVFLENEGFQLVNVNATSLVKQCVGKSKYRRCAPMCEAPGIVDCISLIKWAYGDVGIWLPRDFLLWIDMAESVAYENLRVGDLVFTNGYHNRKASNDKEIGHVGLMTDSGKIIHATNRVGVEEVALEAFLQKRQFCCATRIIPEDGRVISLVIPENQEVEISNDIEWLLLDGFKLSVR